MRRIRGSKGHESHEGKDGPDCDDGDEGSNDDFHDDDMVCSCWIHTTLHANKAIRLQKDIHLVKRTFFYNLRHTHFIISGFSKEPIIRLL